jgi:outer membrane immunogenic protein
MRKLLIAGVALAGFMSNASAADLGKPVYKTPPAPLPPPCVWCGFYVGLNAGYAWSESTSFNSTAVVANNPGLAPIAASAAVAALNTPIPVGNRAGFVGGGQIGWNYQSGSFVGGIETDIQWLSGRSTGTVMTSAPFAGAPLNSANAQLTVTDNVNWLGTLRGRAGFTATPTFLLYGTGGLAYGGVSSNTSISEAFSGSLTTGANGTFPAFGSFSQTRAGWTAGAGGEWMFSGNWSTKLEYLHYDLGSASYGTLVNNFTVAPATPGTLLLSLAQRSSTSFRGDIIRVGINYKFGAAPPVANH